jgi:tRNA threonylcarbamoyladenosine biosynthesis protein TsaE
MEVLAPATRVCEIPDEAALGRLAAKLAAVVKPGMLIALRGPLAAGKTTFARAFLHALGHLGKVKSPTFTLVESYPVRDLTVHHFDLYRLQDPRELYYLGFEDYVQVTTLCLIEWPERGGHELPPFDLTLTLDVLSATERRLSATAGTSHGIALLGVFEHGTR